MKMSKSLMVQKWQWKHVRVRDQTNNDAVHGPNIPILGTNISHTKCPFQQQILLGGCECPYSEAFSEEHTPRYQQQQTAHLELSD